MCSSEFTRRASGYGGYSVTDSVGERPRCFVCCASHGTSTAGSSFGMLAAYLIGVVRPPVGVGHHRGALDDHVVKAAAIEPLRQVDDDTGHHPTGEVAAGPVREPALGAVARREEPGEVEGFFAMSALGRREPQTMQDTCHLCAFVAARECSSNSRGTMWPSPPCTLHAGSGGDPAGRDVACDLLHARVPGRVGILVDAAFRTCSRYGLSADLHGTCQLARPTR